MATLPTQGGDTDTWGTELNEYLLAIPNRQPARAASTANVTLPPGGASLSMDGVTLANADRVLLKMQTAPAENGIYDVSGIGSSVVLTRSFDADAAAKLPLGMIVPVREGTLNYDTVWRLATTAAITLNTTALYMTREFPAYDPLPRSGAGVAYPGAVYESKLRDDTSSTTWTAPASGRVGLQKVMLCAGQVLTGMVFGAQTAGSGLTASWGSLIRASDLAYLRSTNNDTSAAWTAFTARTYTLTTPYTVPYDMAAWACLTQVGTTPSGLNGRGTGIPPVGAGDAFTAYGDTGLTVPPSDGTTHGALTTRSQSFWVAILGT